MEECRDYTLMKTCLSQKLILILLTPRAASVITGHEESIMESTAMDTQEEPSEQQSPRTGKESTRMQTGTLGKREWRLSDQDWHRL